MSERTTIWATFIFGIGTVVLLCLGLWQADQLAEANAANRTIVQLLDRERTYSDSLLAALYESMALTRTCIEGRN